jgi:hypothetical protein
MPRWATSVPFSASTTQEALNTYNAEQAGAPARAAATFDALLAREAARVVNDALLALRHDGHMFHQVRPRSAHGAPPAARAAIEGRARAPQAAAQPNPWVAASAAPSAMPGRSCRRCPLPPSLLHQANLRVLGSGGAVSLLSLWADAVLDRLASLVAWPVRSLKLEDLGRLYLEREARDACNLEYRLFINKAAGTVSRVAIRSIAGGATAGNGTAGANASAAAPPCRAPLMLRGGAALATALGEAPPESGEWGVRTLAAQVPAGGAIVLNVSGSLPWGAPIAALG